MAESGVSGARHLFIRRWGEMAASWGIGRTMAEIHAMLYLAAEPVCTDDVMEQLEVSRGSASTNLRELTNWGLIYRVHRRGDRKEYFVAEKDVWQMFNTISRERRRREMQPIVETLERCLAMMDEARVRGEAQECEAAAYRERFVELQEFCELMNVLFNLLSKAGGSGLGSLTKKLAKLAG